MNVFKNTPKNRARVFKRAKEIFIQDQIGFKYASSRGVCYAINEAFEELYDMDFLSQREFKVYPYDYAFGSAANLPEFMIFANKYNSNGLLMYWFNRSPFGVGRRVAIFDLMIADAESKL